MKCASKGQSTISHQLFIFASSNLPNKISESKTVICCFRRGPHAASAMGMSHHDQLLSMLRSIWNLFLAKKDDDDDDTGGSHYVTRISQGLPASQISTVSAFWAQIIFMPECHIKDHVPKMKMCVPKRCYFGDAKLNEYPIKCKDLGR